MFSSLLRKTSFLVLASVCLSRGAAAQDAVLQVGANILVGRGPEGRLLVEPHLAAHPTDPHHLLAVGWVTTASALTAAREGRSVAHCATFLSSDSGRSWARRDLTSAGCGDPWVALTAQGPAVLTALGRHASLPDSSRQLLVFFSGDGGRTWHDVPQSLGRGHDAPRAAAASDGTVYILSGQGWRDSAGRLRWSVFVGRARPGRLYVEILPRIFPSNLNLNSDGLAVLSDGALVITYNDYQRNVRGFTPDSGVLKGRRTWAMLSTERGEAFSIPLLVTESCYTRPTFLAVDTSSGPYRDRLYHVCVGDRERGILLTYSADRAEQWSEATPIEALGSRDRSRQDPQVAVSGRGIVGIAWNDRRDDPSGRCYAPYFTASHDGGRTFAPGVRVASALSCPDPARNGDAFRRWPTGGDYFGLAASADGRFHLLWSDARNGVFELWTAAVTVRAAQKE